MIRKRADYPKSSDLRAALKRRVDRFIKLTGRSRTDIGMGAVNDSAAVFRIVQDDSNFKIGTYERLMAWLDRNWPTRRGRAKAGHTPPPRDREGAPIARPPPQQ